MYELELTLNEPVEERLILRVGDSPMLKVTLLNYDGTDWPDGYTASLYIGRSNRDPDIWTITGVVDGSHVNVFYFQLEDITYTIGDYDAIVYVNHPEEATPADATPLHPDITPLEDEYDYELDYSFQPIAIEVR